MARQSPSPGRAKGVAASGPAGRRRSARRPSTPAAGLRALVEDSDEGMILADENGMILYANGAAERVLGYPAADLVGRIGFELVEPEHLRVAQEGFGRCLANPDLSVASDVVVRHRDETSRPIAVKLVNRLAVPGVNAVVVHFREVSPGAPTRDLALEPADNYRTLFYNAPVGLGVADLDGTLLAFNDAMLQPGGYSREDIQRLGNVARLYCHATERDRVLELARSQGRVWREEVQFRRKDGSCYDTLLSLTPVQYGGRSCWYAAVEDITGRKQVEERQRQLEGRLRQAQKMEAVGNMTAGISHDFNNILSVITMSADLMAEALEREETHLRDHVADLQEAAQLGAATVRKLLAFSRHADLHREPIDLTEVVSGLHTMVRRLAPEPVRLDIKVVPGAVADVDPSALEQMVLNLVTNACDAMPGGGRLTIEAAPMVLSAAERPGEWMEPGPYARVMVTDTGIGMDPRTRARAFEPFFTTKRAGAGTGLGLAMVYGLVKQQEGFVDLQSEVGTGTSVSLYFPRRAEG